MNRQTKRQVLATLIRAGRRDLARCLVRAEPDVRSAVMKFFQENPYPKDSAVHGLAESLGIDPHKLETVIYGLLSDLLAGKGAEGSTRITAGRKLDRGLQQKVNKDLTKAGLDGNGRFKRIGEALNAIAKVLEKHGLQQDDVFSADLFRGSKGNRTFAIAFSTDDPFSPETIENSLLVVQWYELQPGMLEVLSYLS